MADLIERYKITANLPSVLMNYCNRFNSKQLESITEMIYELENSIESADVQPVKRGNWVQIGEQSAKCTECGGVLKSNGIDKTGKALIFNAVYHYCPNCGARMIKDGDTE